MKKYRYKFGNGLAHYENKDIKMLEDMAAQGYALEKVSKLGYYKFCASKPDDCTYAIDFSDICKKDDGFLQYVDIFSASNWGYVTSIDNVHYFKAPKSTKPIYTDSTSMAEKYVQMQDMCKWWVVVSFIFIAIYAASYFAFPQFFFLPILGAGVGLCWAMYDGFLLNKRRVAQLREDQISSNLQSSCDKAHSADNYIELSRSCGRAFLWSIFLVAVMTVINWAGIVGLIPMTDRLYVMTGNIVGLLWGTGITYAMYKAFGFFSYRQKAKRLNNV